MRSGKATTTTRSAPHPSLWEGSGIIPMHSTGSTSSLGPTTSVSASNGGENPSNGAMKGCDPKLVNRVQGTPTPSAVADPSTPTGHDSCRDIDSPSNETSETAVSSTMDDPLVELLDDDDGNSFASSHGRTYPSSLNRHESEASTTIDSDHHLSTSRNVDSPYTTSSVLTDSTEEGPGAGGGPVPIMDKKSAASSSHAAIRDPMVPLTTSYQELTVQDITPKGIGEPKGADNKHQHHNSSRSLWSSSGNIKSSDHGSEASQLENTEVEHEDDDEDDEDAGVIAIGLPAVMMMRSNSEGVDDSNHCSSSTTALPPPPATMDEANQRLVSDIVAQNLAEQEHNMKHGHKDRSMATLMESGVVHVVPRSPVARRRIVAASTAIPTVTSPTLHNKGDDEMIRIKNQERERMARSVMASASSLKPPPTSIHLAGAASATATAGASSSSSTLGVGAISVTEVVDRDNALKRAIQREMQRNSNVRPPIRSPEWISSSAASSTSPPTPPVKPSASAYDKDDAIKQAIKNELRGHVALARASSSDSAATTIAGNVTTTAATTQQQEDKDAALKRSIQQQMQGAAVVVARSSAMATTAAVTVATQVTPEDKDMALKRAIQREMQGSAAVVRPVAATAAATAGGAPKDSSSLEDKDAAFKKAIQREMQGSAMVRPPAAAVAGAPKDVTVEDKDAALKKAIQREMQGSAVVRPSAATGAPKVDVDDKDAALKKSIQQEMQGRATAQPSASHAVLERVRLEQAKMQQGSTVGAHAADGPQLATAKEDDQVAIGASWVKEDSKMPASSTASTTASSATAAASAYATARFRQELVKMMTEDADEAGPSLAPASGSGSEAPKVGAGMASVPKLPGAYHGTNTEDVTKALDDGPRLAPAAEFIDLEVPTSPAASPSAAASGGMTRTLSTSSDLEAQMGIPVLPGAFAVEGIQSPSRRRRRSSNMDSGNHGTSYDSYDDEDEDSYDDEDYDENGLLRSDDFDDEHTVNSGRRRNRRTSDAELGMGDAYVLGADASTYPMDAALANAFEAELHVVVEGAVINPEDEFQVDPKAVKKLRIMQGCIVCFSLAAIGIIVGIILGFQKGQAEVSLGWTQVGSDLIGPKEEPQTFFGQSVVTTSDGTRVAAAAPGVDVELELNVGEVYIMDASKMKNGSSEWVVHETLVGKDPTDNAKSSLAMSLDGKILVSGLPHLGTSGVVSTFQESSGQWKVLGSNLQPDSSSAATTSDASIWFGYAVSLTADGTFMAVSAPMLSAKTSSSSKTVERVGAVYCYRLVQGEWNEVAVLQGVDENEMLGWSVSIQATKSGYRLAAGGPSHDSEQGLARIYDSANGIDWTLTITLLGDTPLIRFGESLALNSADATVLAVGARGSALDKGQVHVYRIDDKASGVWIEDAPLLEGQEHAEGYGACVALSEDGTTLAIGAPQSSQGGVDAGRVEVHSYDASQRTWIMEGMSITGATGEEFGSAVALAMGGTRVVVGAPSTTFDGSIAQAGAVRVYDRDA